MERVVGGRKKWIRLAVAYEIIHAGWLIHDDIIDEDDMRRGGPSMHKLFKDWFKSKGVKNDFEHLGLSIAILSGDTAVFMAKKNLVTSGLPPTVIIQVLQDFYYTMINTVYGESIDVLMSYMKSVQNMDYVLRACELKTARYTIDGPLHVGAIAAGANDKSLNSLSRFAVPVGIAFQIRDDIIGIFGTTQEIGKPAGSDLKEGKFTLLVLKALEMGSKEQKKELEGLLDKKKITANDLSLARKIIKETGSLDFAQKYAEKLVIQGKKSLDKLKGVNKDSKELLISIADYIIKRRY